MLKFFRNSFSAFGPSLMMAATDKGGPSGEITAQANLGRNGGPELFYSFNHDGTVQNVQIPRVLNLDRGLEALILRWRGRLVIGTANYTSVAAEAPYTIIDRIQVQGTYKGNQLTPIYLTGGTAFTLLRCFSPYGNTALFGTTRQADPSSPFAQLGANFGNTGTYDLDITWIIPTGPIIAPAARTRGNVRFNWQPQDWTNLQVTLFMGDRTSFGTPAGGTTTTFTAFGSASGTPSVEVHTRYEIAGDLRGQFRSAVLVRNESVVTQGLGAVANNITLSPLQKQKTTNLLLKTGIAQTGSSNGVGVFASLSDTILDVTQIVKDNRPVRNNLSNIVSKASIAQRFGTIMPQGYLPFSFIDGQSPRAAYRADLPEVVSQSAAFDLRSNVLAATANQQLNFIQEMVFADAGDPYWQGTR